MPMKPMKFMKSVKKKILKKVSKDRGAVYTRMSSKTNKHGASIARQKEAARRAAAQQQTAIVKTVSEVISGRCHCRGADVPEIKGSNGADGAGRRP